MNRETQPDPTQEAASTADDAFSELRGRQSVRATFKLTDSCIEAISIVAAQLGIKQKSLFDHLLQDTQTLNAIASQFRNARLQTANRIQKTYVISRGALLSLEEVARNFNAPRDALIEFSVQRLLPVIAQERKLHGRRKALFEKIDAHIQAGRELLKEAYTELGASDPLTDRLAAAMNAIESAFRHMSAYIEKNEGIEDFEPDAYRKIKIIIEEP
jgi:predicted DNA-binding protein YlxM (UPF0122 family)